MATPLTITLLYRQTLMSSAAPISEVQRQIENAKGNTTVLGSEIAPSWASAPNARGTADLLWSCVLTLTICVYTVIHINVPPQEEGYVKFLLRKTKWVFTAILAPELCLHIAYEQWSTARKLSKHLTSLREKDEEKTGIRDHNPNDQFGMTYGFYAAMGGFVVDVSEMHDRHTRFTILPQGILFLADRGHFLEVDKLAVEDRSKADLLAKTLMCVQVSWMVVQCIGRKASGYPISLLEVHVLVHVFCALCMYALWIKKPLDIQTSTLIDSSKFVDVLALLLLETEDSDELPGLQLYEVGSKASSVPNPELAPTTGIQASQDLPAEATKTNDVEVVTHKTLESDPDVVDQTKTWRYSGDESSDAATVCTLEPGQALRCGLGPDPKGRYRVTLTAKAVKRWTSASKAIRDRPDIYKNGSHKFGKAHLLANHSSNMSSFSVTLDAAKAFHESAMDSPLIYISVLVLPLIYGGIHLAAWRFNFPTSAEHVLWKAAGITIMAFPFVLLALLVLLLLSGALGVGGELFISILVFLAIIVCFLLAIAARIFLVVESFISVRQLPIGVYMTVEWSNYIPHL